ncbi:MAG: GH36-type glycosyl hydrolase domain-containing protein, partial [Opitutaceae bacterium]
LKEFGLLELRNQSPLVAQLLPSGALFAFRHEETLLNQFLPGPAEEGLFRLILRWRDDGAQGEVEPIESAGWARLSGPGIAFGCDERAATWRAAPSHSGLDCTTTLALHPAGLGWAWRIQIVNTGFLARYVDALHAQDLGLADEGAVRNNEAYVSQYIDLLPVEDAHLGHVVLARQNQPMAGGRRPWLGFACVDGAAAFCTDGWHFFGGDHRATGEPVAVRLARLSSCRLQYEFALAGLQSREVLLGPGESVEFGFVARFLEDHPAASSDADVARISEMLPLDWFVPRASSPAGGSGSSVFIDAPWAHGTRLLDTEWKSLFPGERRHEEVDAAGRLLSFFHGPATHVVSGDKEALVARPHGHILRSGDARWIDDDQFGLTCHAAGIFAAQAYLGNPSLARLLGVVRNPLNVARASGQRVFVRRGGAWRQLGVPSAFAIEPGGARWIYRLGKTLLEARVWCSASLPASFLELSIADGPPVEFLVTHQLVLGSNEFESAVRIDVHADGWMGCLPDPDGLMAKHLPETAFAIGMAGSDDVAAHGGDALIHADGIQRHGPYAAFLTRPVRRCAFVMLGVTDGPENLGPMLSYARSEYASAAGRACFPPAPLRLRRRGDSDVARIDEVLPWFTHNAAIHFSAPHGLEQYGGAAWGVRDVCQGSLEWLLASGEFATVRRMLQCVFAQQYPHDGSWPQWFMFPPFRFIQQAHSHGDVCFWPLKALCDYVEAGDDLRFLQTAVGYVDPESFEPCGPAESLWAHCDRVIEHAQSRFVPGTALVDYGDGDWDDTLQPADPAMRTRMISAWTVGLAYQTFRQLTAVASRAGEKERAQKLDTLVARMHRDFHEHLMPAGVVAGFLVNEEDGTRRPLLHPLDRVTGIRYRLLPMTRSVLAELFTPDEAERHLALVESELLFPDGVRLMSEPSPYHGGCERLFKRADTAANVGREIGLQYVHAHLRYAEAMARVGNADALWRALQVVNPVGLHKVLPQAAPRQSNVYFSSSDADFDNRLEAAARWEDLRAGRVAVRGGWRLYSSGPGLFLHKVRACLLGLRESFGDVVFDPVLPLALDGLVAEVKLLGRPVQIRYAVRHGNFAPRALTVNGTRITDTPREPNPYRAGGLRVSGATLVKVLQPEENRIELEL